MGSQGAAEGGAGRAGGPRGRDAVGGPLQALLVILLTLTAGCGDGIAFLALDQVFTANMTGNTVLIGLAAGTGRASSAAGPGVALGGFAAGVAIGTLVAQAVRAARGGARPWFGTWPAGVTVALGVQLGVLLAFATGLLQAGTAPGRPSCRRRWSWSCSWWRPCPRGAEAGRGQALTRRSIWCR